MTAGDEGRDVLRAQLEDHRSVAEATAGLLPVLEDLTVPSEKTVFEAARALCRRS